MLAAIASSSKIKAWIFQSATRAMLAQKKATFENQSKLSLGSLIADKLVLGKIKRMIGFDRVKVIASGGAPLNQKTFEFFLSLGLVITEVYGMSETTGCATLNAIGDCRLGSVGCANEYCNIKIADPDRDGIGEICFSGKSVFMGYLNLPDKTREAFDDEGFLRSGDLGRFDQDGFLYVTGRSKELIITAGGENVAPVPIEDAIKNELPEIVSNCMVVGDKKQFLVVLITLKVSSSMFHILISINFHLFYSKQGANRCQYISSA